MQSTVDISRKWLERKGIAEAGGTYMQQISPLEQFKKLWNIFRRVRETGPASGKEKIVELLQKKDSEKTKRYALEVALLGWPDQSWEEALIKHTDKYTDSKKEEGRD